MAPLNPDPHALLSALAPSLRTTAILVTPFRKSPRIVDLRANILRLYRPSSRSPKLLHTIQIVHTSQISRIDSSTVLVDFHSLVFPSAHLAACFHLSVLSAVSAHLPHPPNNTHRILAHIPKEDALFSASHLQSLVHHRVALQQATLSSSPFLIPLSHAYESQSSFVFATTFVPRLSLLSLFSEHPSLPVDVVRHIFAELLMALQDIHDIGFLFRNLHPQHVLLSSEGHVKLGDFSNAKPVFPVQQDPCCNRSSTISDSDSTPASHTSKTPSTASCPVTPLSQPSLQRRSTTFRKTSHVPPPPPIGRTRSFVGPRTFMSPELLASSHSSDRSYGPAADVWALGILLYLMTTGTHPFARKLGDATLLFDAIAHEEIDIPENLDPDLRELLSGLLQKDERLRLQLHEVRTMKWLSEVQWSELRDNALNERAVPAVVKAMDNIQIVTPVLSEVSDLESSTDIESTSDEGNDEKLSELQRRWSERCPRRRRQLRRQLEQRLLGFEISI